MSYFDKVAQPGEKIIHRGELHWIIYLRAFVTIAVGVVILALFGRQAGEQGNPFPVIVAGCFGLVGVSLFLHAWFIKVTSEIIVTNMRIIGKRGFISRRTQEMNISKVETVDVAQSIIGRLLGYGTVVIRGTGGGWEPLVGVAAPLELRNAVVVG
jgi:uncharacterized membrane protein YdbT with pleckstrin-like domain